MPSLYALCRPAGPLEVKHVQLTAQLQIAVSALFQHQEQELLAARPEEVDFTGDWKPDPDELLVIHGLVEAQALLDAAAQNAVALPPLDVANFDAEEVKALMVSAGAGAHRRLLIQAFNAQQLLTTRFSLLHDGNMFRRLTEPAFALAPNLAAMIDANAAVRFASFAVLRRILDVTPIFRNATDQELAAFCASPHLAIANAAAFMADADEIIRKQVLSIMRAGVLDALPVADIQAQAVAIGFPIQVHADQLEVPPDRKGTKALFSFLLNKVYRGPLSHELLITNSTRPLA